VWTTDKDGIILDLLAAEMTARTTAIPPRSMMNSALTSGASVYERIDAPATA
jgi:phosphoglucomutase